MKNLRKNLFPKQEIGRPNSSRIRVWLIRSGAAFITIATLICAAAAAYYAGMQTRISQEQNILAESARRAGLSSEMTAIFEALRQEQQAFCSGKSHREFCDENKNVLMPDVKNKASGTYSTEKFHLSNMLYARIVSLAAALRPYQYLRFDEANPAIQKRRIYNCGYALIDSRRMLNMERPGDEIRRAYSEIDSASQTPDKLTVRPYSPERSQLFRYIASAKIDLTSLATRESDFSRMDLDNAHLEWIDMPDANFAASRFVGATLDHANIPDATLDESDFTCASLTYSNLNGIYAERVSFAGADLSETSMVFASITDSDFRVKRLGGADLRRAALLNTCLGNPESFVGSTIDRQTLVGALVSSEAWLDGLAKYGESVHGFKREEWDIAPAKDKSCDGRSAFRILWPKGFDFINYLNQNPLEKKASNNIDHPQFQLRRRKEASISGRVIDSNR